MRCSMAMLASLQPNADTSELAASWKPARSAANATPLKVAGPNRVNGPAGWTGKADRAPQGCQAM
jgi:hypothetical protein